MSQFACTKQTAVQYCTIHSLSLALCVPEMQEQPRQQVAVWHLVLPWHAVQRCPECCMYSGFWGCCCCFCHCTDQCPLLVLLHGAKLCYKTAGCKLQLLATPACTAVKEAEAVESGTGSTACDSNPCNLAQHVSDNTNSNQLST